MRHIRKFAAVIMTGFLFLLGAGADQWPFPVSGIDRVMGSNDAGSFFPGIVFAGKGEPVKPAMNGELVYHSEPEDPVFPTNFGGVAVLEHDNSFRSVYGGIDTDPQVFRKNIIAMDQIMGTSERLYFYILDMKLGQYVNPARILPGIGDKQSPRIKNVQITGMGISSSMSSDMSLKAGEYEIFVNGDDSFQGKSSPGDLIPYELILTYNGMVVSSVRFDSLKSEKGTAFLTGNNPLPWNALYERAGFIRLGKVGLTAGRGVLMVLVKDCYGNQSEWISVINVR
jgi:hypothetical protein